MVEYRNCAHCQRSFRVSNPKQRFCARACVDANRVIANRENKSRCAQCAKPIANGKFCDRKCYGEYNRLRMVLTQEPTKDRRGEKRATRLVRMMSGGFD